MGPIHNNNGHLQVYTYIASVIMPPKHSYTSEQDRREKEMDVRGESSQEKENQVGWLSSREVENASNTIWPSDPHMFSRVLGNQQ